MVFLISFSVSFITFLFTLAPTVYNLDSAELTTAAATLGFTRSTGYPLYILLGNFWSKIPVGDVGFRLNLFSAFSGALTVGFSTLILKHFQVKVWALLGSLGLLVTSKFFWALSLIAEVYTLQTALMAALILCVLHWQKRPTAARMILVGIVSGLCLCHHAATIIMLPAILLFLVFVSRKNFFKPSVIGAGLVGILIGLTPYLYFPIRFQANPVFNYAGTYDSYGQFHPFKLDTLNGLWELISAKSFQGLAFAYNPEEAIVELRIFARNLWQAFMAIGIGPGIMGFYLLFKRNWQTGLLFLMIFLGHAIFFINYRVVDKELMFLPNYLIWALWLGVGYEWLQVYLLKINVFPTAASTTAMSALGLWIFRAVLVGFVGISLVIRYPLVNQADNWTTRQLGERILDQTAPGALVFGYWDVVPVIEYLQYVEGQRPDVQAVNRFLISREELVVWISREISRRPIYVDSRIAELPHTIAYIRQGELLRLRQIKP